MLQSVNTSLKYLRRGVGLGSAVGLTQFARCCLAHEAEVTDLDVVASVDEQVLELEVSVSDVQLVHVAHRRRYLGGPESRSVLADSTRRLNVLQRVAAVCVLQHHVDALAVL